MFSYGPRHVAEQKQDDQLCEDMGCSLEDQPEAMNIREEWQERRLDTMMMMMMMNILFNMKYLINLLKNLYIKF